MKQVIVWYGYCYNNKFNRPYIYIYIYTDAVLSISFLAIFSAKYGVVCVRLTHSGLDDRDDIYEIIHKNVPIFIISSFIFRWLCMRWFKCPIPSYTSNRPRGRMAYFLLLLIALSVVCVNKNDTTKVITAYLHITPFHFHHYPTACVFRIKSILTINYHVTREAVCYQPI